MSEHPAKVVDTSVRERYEALLTHISAIVGRGPAEKGTAKMAAAVAAVPELSPDAALLALLPDTEASLRQSAGWAKGRLMRATVMGYGIGHKAAEANRLELAVDAAVLLQSSSWARERLFNFAKSKGLDALADTTLAVEGWSNAGRIDAAKCPECGAVLVALPAERAEPDTNYGGCSSGTGCNNCHFEDRTYRAPTGRGSDGPFISGE